MRQEAQRSANLESRFSRIDLGLDLNVGAFRTPLIFHGAKEGHIPRQLTIEETKIKKKMNMHDIDEPADRIQGIFVFQVRSGQRSN